MKQKRPENLKLPSIRYFSSTRKHPLEKFYAWVTRQMGETGGKVSVQHVMVGIEDGKALKAAVLAWNKKNFRWAAHKATRCAAWDWFGFGPVENPDVQKGHVEVLTGWHRPK